MNLFPTMILGHCKYFIPFFPPCCQHGSKESSRGHDGWGFIFIHSLSASNSFKFCVYMNKKKSSWSLRGRTYRHPREMSCPSQGLALQHGGHVVFLGSRALCSLEQWKHLLEGTLVLSQVCRIKAVAWDKVTLQDSAGTDRREARSHALAGRRGKLACPTLGCNGPYQVLCTHDLI